MDGEKVNDHYYLGVDFEIGLRNYGFPKEITLRVYPMAEDMRVYLEKRPTFKNGRALGVENVRVKKEYRYILKGERAKNDKIL